MTGDWRDWRPAIWLTMLGIAAMLLVSPFCIGALFFGAAIGAAIRINQRRRRAAAIAAREAESDDPDLGAGGEVQASRLGVMRAAAAVAGGPAVARGRTARSRRELLERRLGAVDQQHEAGALGRGRPSRSRAWSRSRTTDSATASLYSVAELPQRGRTAPAARRRRP